MENILCTKMHDNWGFCCAKSHEILMKMSLTLLIMSLYHLEMCYIFDINDQVSFEGIPIA